MAILSDGVGADIPLAGWKTVDPNLDHLHAPNQKCSKNDGLWTPLGCSPSWTLAKLNF